MGRAETGVPEHEWRHGGQGAVAVRSRCCQGARRGQGAQQHPRYVRLLCAAYQIAVLQVLGQGRVRVSGRLGVATPRRASHG